MLYNVYIESFKGKRTFKKINEGRRTLFILDNTKVGRDGKISGTFTLADPYTLHTCQIEPDILAQLKPEIIHDKDRINNALDKWLHHCNLLQEKGKQWPARITEKLLKENNVRQDKQPGTLQQGKDKSDTDNRADSSRL